MPVPDGIGKLALPGLVEAHTQLDKSLLGLPWYRNDVGERLNDKIENERAVRKMLPIDPTRQSNRHAMLAVSHGSTFIRSHVDVDTECGVNIENSALDGDRRKHSDRGRGGGRVYPQQCLNPMVLDNISK